MRNLGRRKKRSTSAWARVPRVSLAAPPARRFLPVLLGAVILLVACVSQRFSIAQIHQENADLRAELDKRTGERDREEAKVGALLCRGRIERIAGDRLRLRPPEPGEQVFLAEWTAEKSAATAGFFGGAGRGWTELLGLVRGGEAAVGGTGGGR